jgi:phosphoglycerate dehydrogenase-like enzyme
MFLPNLSDALFDALENGIVSGAGLDVFVDEPPLNIPQNKLVNHTKV